MIKFKFSISEIRSVITDFSLDIGGSEWVIIILLGFFLLFGNKKVPEVGRKLGRLMAQYEKTKRAIQDEITKASTDVRASVKFDPTTSTAAKAEGTTNVPAKVDGNTNTDIAVSGRVASEREKLEIIAKTLEIDPRGKSTDELKQLISSKMNP